ncbi:MAG: hypothetical protein MJA84_03205 [Firmicutes bacterium]|nr:hypothetical protein [Bacillota bacterium]
MINLLAIVKGYCWWTRFKSLALVCIVAINFVYVFYPYAAAKALISCATLLLLALSLPYAGRGNKWVSVTLFVIGAYLMLISGAGAADWMEAVIKNTGLLVLLIVVPLLGIPLKSAGYVQVLDVMASNYMQKNYQLYWIPGLFSHILGFFMNIGSVPLAYEITARGKVAQRAALLARTLSRGTGAIFIWSPSTVAVALVLEYLQVPWTGYFLLGFAFAVTALVWGYLTEVLVNLKNKVYDTPNAVSPGGAKRPVHLPSLMQIIVYMALFLLMIMLIDLCTPISIIAVIPMVAVTMPALWLVISGHRGMIKSAYVEHFVTKAHQHDGEVVLFVAAGFFSSALILSGWSDGICNYIMNFAGHSNASIAFTILGAIVLASLVGIHPMITVSTFATSLDVSSLGFGPVYLALLLAGGWSLGSIISPIAGNVLIVASVTGGKPMEIVCNNLLHACLVFATIVIFMALI